MRKTKADGMMGDEPETRYAGICKELRQKLEEYGKKKTAIAFTGELKSRILLKAASGLEEEKRSRFFAVTAESCLRPKLEAERARREGMALGMNHYIFTIDELKNGQIRRNGVDKCGQCRRYLFKQIRKLCDALKTDQIVCGVNADDWKEIAVRRTAEEFGLKAPLAELGIFRHELPGIARELGLTLYGDFFKTCYTSCFPEGTILTMEKLNQAEQGESFLHSLNVWDVKLQVIGQDVWLLAGKQAVAAVVSHREEIVEYLKTLGYQRVVLDLEAGSGNR